MNALTDFDVAIDLDDYDPTADYGYGQCDCGRITDIDENGECQRCAGGLRDFGQTPPVWGGVLDEMN